MVVKTIRVRTSLIGGYGDQLVLERPWQLVALCSRNIEAATPMIYLHSVSSKSVQVAFAVDSFLIMCIYVCHQLVVARACFQSCLSLVLHSSVTSLGGSSVQSLSLVSRSSVLNFHITFDNWSSVSS